MYVTTEFTIDFQRPRKNIMQVVQDDTTRKIRLILKDGGNDYGITSDLKSGETWVGAVAYLKSDRHGGVYDTTEGGDAAVQLVSGTTNQFDVLLVGQVFTAAGWTQINIKFYNADFSKVLSTFSIDVNVQRNAASDYESEDYSNMQSLGAIRAEMVAFEATVRDELASISSNPEFAYITIKNSNQENGITVSQTAASVLSFAGATPQTKPVLRNIAGPVMNNDAATKAYVDAKGGLSDEAKDALLDCFEHVAWTDEHGQDYYDALEAALYPPTNLVSISAVFEQGQTVVYDTDSLDVLKPMLTVTAHYSDATSETVTAYTLSGTLTAGTSTITVSYGGKTATFDVTVTHDNHLYFTIIHGGHLTTDTELLYNYSQQGQNRATVNPFGHEIESGKSYTISIGSLTNKYSYAANLLTVPNPSTVDNIIQEGVDKTVCTFSQRQASGWKTDSEYVITGAGGFNYVQYVFKLNDSGDISDSDIAELQAAFTCVVS